MIPPDYDRDGITLYRGDCLAILPTIPSGSVDAVISDPIYPEIDRPYGRISEAEWHDLMRVVVAECRRILKPSGSAVFILQPNSERVGRMRPWLWEFMAWTAREWNQVQDIWWINPCAAPTIHCNRDRGLMRLSAKACVWLGPPDCYRDQDSILDAPATATMKDNRRGDTVLRYSPSGQHTRHNRRLTTWIERGGVTPLNAWIGPHAAGSDEGGAHGHGASTPGWLADRWVRYISPPGGIILDPFMGSGTIPLAAVRRNRSAIGFEQMPEYFEMAQARLDGPPTPLFDGIADLPVADETPLLSGLEAAP
jgi:DNA modification methylase